MASKSVRIFIPTPRSQKIITVHRCSTCAWRYEQGTVGHIVDVCLLLEQVKDGDDEGTTTVRCDKIKGCGLWEPDRIGF